MLYNHIDCTHRWFLTRYLLPPDKYLNNEILTVELEVNDNFVGNTIYYSYKYNSSGSIIESSINSVRVSIKIKQADEIETILCHKYDHLI